MTKFIITLSKPVLVLCLAFVSLNSYAQQATEKSSAQRETHISNVDLIKLATKAPFRENFNSEEEYGAAKQAWIKEYPDAYERISEPKSQSSATTEEQQIAAKQAWIDAHPEEYAKMLEGSSTRSTAPQY